MMSNPVVILSGVAKHFAVGIASSPAQEDRAFRWLSYLNEARARKSLSREIGIWLTEG
ncbi:MAG TPA: hypothetical protein V6D50_14025 [Chroococcales cyanobacterium]